MLEEPIKQATNYFLLYMQQFSLVGQITAQIWNPLPCHPVVSVVGREAHVHVAALTAVDTSEDPWMLVDSSSWKDEHQQAL